MLDLFARASQLADCLCTALGNQDYPEEDDKWRGMCCVFPGSDIELTNCCEEGGTAWVTIQGGGISSGSFPDLQPAPVNCTEGNTLAVTFEVGVARAACATTCDCGCKERLAQNIMLDFQAMMRGIACCLNATDDEWVLNSFQFFGPEGLCAGSSMLVTVREPMPCC